MLELGTSGSVGGEGGNLLVYPASLGERWKKQPRAHGCTAGAGIPASNNRLLEITSRSSVGCKDR
jgi:hypothetical protein